MPQTIAGPEAAVKPKPAVEQPEPAEKKGAEAGKQETPMAWSFQDELKRLEREAEIKILKWCDKSPDMEKQVDELLRGETRFLMMLSDGYPMNPSSVSLWMSRDGKNQWTIRTWELKRGGPPAPCEEKSVEWDDFDAASATIRRNSSEFDGTRCACDGSTWFVYLFDSNARHWIGSTNPWIGAVDADFTEGTKASEPEYLAVNRLIHAMLRMQFGDPGK